jgi:flagellar basal body P-ring protein FlgI
LESINSRIPIQESEPNQQNDSEVILNENAKLEELVSSLKSELEICQKSKVNEESMISECQRLTNELENVRKEQEDLLVLLTDQDSKLRHYKKRLKELGQSVRTQSIIL